MMIRSLKIKIMTFSKQNRNKLHQNNQNTDWIKMVTDASFDVTAVLHFPQIHWCVLPLPLVHVIRCRATPTPEGTETPFVLKRH